MPVARIGNWSTLASGDPTGALTIGAGADRAFILVITNEAAATWHVSAIQVGGQSPSQTHQLSSDDEPSANIALFIWNEAAIAAMSGSTVSNYVHSGAESGQNWQYGTFETVNQSSLGQWSSDAQSSVDSLDLVSESFSDDRMIVVAARNDAARSFATFGGFDSLTPVSNTDNGQGYRHALAEGAGGDNLTTLLGDGTPASLTAGILVLNAGAVILDASFTSNGVLTLGDTHKDNLDMLLSAMDGRLSYTGGLWTLRASVWKEPTFIIRERHVVGEIKVRGSAPRSNRFNTVRGFFVDPARNYEAVEFPHVSRAAYVTRDNGRRLEYDLQLPMTNDRRMAQRLAFRILDQGNNQIIAEIPVNAEGADIKIGDTFAAILPELTWGFKTFRCIGWQPTADGGFLITGREDSAASYTNPTATDYDDQTKIDPTIAPIIVPAPTNFTASAVPLGIKWSWRNPSKFTYDLVDIYVSGNNQFSNAQRIASVRGDTYTQTLDEGEVRFGWIRARLLSGAVSLRTPDSDTSTITATAGNTSGCTFGSLGGKTLFNGVGDPTDANCGYRLNSDGFIYTRQGLGAWVQAEQWIGSCINTSYEARMTLNSGAGYTTGTAGAWQLLSTSRDFELLVTSPGDASNNGTIEIRRIDDDVVGFAAVITMESQVE